MDSKLIWWKRTPEEGKSSVRNRESPQSSVDFIDTCLGEIVNCEFGHSYRRRGYGYTITSHKGGLGGFDSPARYKWSLRTNGGAPHL